MLSNSSVKQIDVIKIYEQKSCLVVDDLPEVRGSIKRMLKSFGAQRIDTAANGDQAIEHCENREYGIVLCDYNLGGSKDGQQVLEELRYMRTLNYTTLYIIITAETSREMVLGALEYQPDDYITKPIAQSLLRKRLDRALLKHEELYPIKHAIDEQQYQQAILHCDKLLDSNTRYAADCLKYKAILYKMLGHYDKSRAIYEAALSNRSVSWAKIGLAGVMMRDGTSSDVIENELQEILDIDHRFIEAHDMLAQLYERDGRFDEALAATQRATELSPKSILRHRQLADLAERTEDVNTSLTAYQNAIRWNHNSCHANPEDYLQLARKTVDVTAGKSSRDAVDKTKNALSMLDRMRKRFDQKEKQVQALMVESQIHAGQGRHDLAKNLAAEAERKMHALDGVSVETQFDFVKSQLAAGSQSKASRMLYDLAKNNANDKKILDRVDNLSDEPISTAGKKCAAELSKNGINAYTQKDYDKALAIFEDALCMFPNHIGLNLNLVQVALAKTSDSGLNDHLKTICEKSLAKVSDMDSEHKQYERFQFLSKQLAKTYSSKSA